MRWLNSDRDASVKMYPFPRVVHLPSVHHSVPLSVVPSEKKNGYYDETNSKESYKTAMKVILIYLSDKYFGCYGNSLVRDVKIFTNGAIYISDVTAECLRQASWGRCEFYECLERRFPCGSEGYTTQIGLHFCHKITHMFDTFTETVIYIQTICCYFIFVFIHLFIYFFVIFSEKKRFDISSQIVC